MIHGVKRFIENRFFKERYILLISKEDFPKLHKPMKDKIIECKVESTKDKKYVNILKNICNNIYIIESMKKIFINFDNSILISAYYNGEVAGCIVIIIPSEPILYDSCRHTSDQVRFTRLYVNSKYRRKGISSNLRYFALNYWHNNYPDRTVVGVIERSNYASFQGARKMNCKIGATNYLIKFFGINIISLTNYSKKWELLLLFRDQILKDFKYIEVKK